MTYDDILIKADSHRLIIKEKPLHGSDGRIYDNRIAIRNNIPTSVEKSCVLAEELGHYFTTSGDIIYQDDEQNRKQELKARLVGYDIKIGLLGIISAFEHGCRNLHEMAEHLDSTEEYINQAIETYRNKYGVCVRHNNYIIYFIPSLCIIKMNN